LGRAPEEVNELSYGNSPFQINPYAGRTGSYVPEMKRGRGAQLFDALSLLSLPGARTVAGGLFGGGLTPGVDAAATVYHGSPHKFDRFDSSKIGTGEGAQAYGHGLYLADSPAVAGSYKTGGGGFQAAMPSDNVMIDGKTWAKTLPRSSIESQAATVFKNDLFGSTIPEKVAKLRAAKMEPVADWLEKNAGRLSLDQGSLYKVDLPDEAIAKMLDWDKPLSQQAPEVQASFLKAQSSGDPLLSELLDLSPAGMQIQGMVPAAQGSAAYKTMAQNIGHAAASQKLRQAGIPGIRYLDGGSRSAGAGSSNYVIFPGNENMLRILERNGQAMPAPAQRLYHGGLLVDSPIADKQGALIGGTPGVSFSTSPLEAARYAIHNKGNLYRLQADNLRIFQQGADPVADAAFQAGDFAALKKQGFDGMRIGAGSNEVVLFDPKTAKQAQKIGTPSQDIFSSRVFSRVEPKPASLERNGQVVNPIYRDPMGDTLADTIR